MQLGNVTLTIPSTTSLGNSLTDTYVDKLPLWLHAFGFGLYLLLLVLAFVVDTAILFVFYRVKELRNVTNNLLCNMVVADLLFALQTPAEALSIKYDEWIAGNALCKIHRFLLHAFYNVVIISLTIVSLERYHAICHPMRFKSLNIKSWILALVSWIAACILALPQVFVSSTIMSKDRLVCTEERPDDYLVVFLCYHVPLFILLYFIPLVILSFTFARVSRKLRTVVQRFRSRSRFDICDAMKMRRSIIRMLLVVVIVFAVCLTPLTIIELLHVTPVMDQFDPFGTLVVTVETLAFLHALLNPLVSSFMSKEFRKAAKKAFRILRSLKGDYCMFIRKKENTKCKLKQVKQSEAIGADNEKRVEMDIKNANDLGDIWKEKGTHNEGFSFALDTIARTESSLTETTDIPKEEECS